MFKGQFPSYLFALCCVTLLLSCSLHKTRAVPADASFHYLAGLDLAKAKEWDRAEMEFRFALERDPLFSPAHFGLASLYFRKDDLKTAEYYINQALKIKPAWLEARLLKGKILFRKGQFTEALDYFNEDQMTANGNNGKQFKAELFLWKGQALQSIGKMEEAGWHIRKSLDLKPGYPEAQQALRYQNIYESFSGSDDEILLKIARSKTITRSEWSWLLVTKLIRDKNISNGELAGPKVPTAENQESEKETMLPSDVPVEYWAREVILRSLEAGAMFTFPDGSFMPDRLLRRAEIILTLKNMQKKFRIDPGNIDVHNKFLINDLPELHPLYSTAVDAVALGLVELDQDKNIRLNGTVSGREALLAMAGFRKIMR